MFEAELSGLKLLESALTTGIPQPLTAGIFDGYSWLLMDFISPGKRKAEYYETLGRNLARLHRNTTGKFGLDQNNYIGTLTQVNNLTVSGCDFMISCRFRPLAEMAFDKKLLSQYDMNLFESLYKKLNDLLPDEPPALLHGDLWSGNVITGPD